MSIEIAQLQQIKNKSNIKSYQTGYVSTSTLSSSTGEDLEYIDIIISSVDTEKSLIMFDGGGGNTDLNSSFYKSGDIETTQCTYRLTSSTNLRISTSLNGFAIGGRWTVIEFY